jgi:hypothetical protein
MPDFTYVCPWEGDGTDENPFVPKVHLYHQVWRAVDGRLDPALAGGVSIVEAFDVPGNVHAEIISDDDIDLLIPANVAALSQASIGQSHTSIPDFIEALRERCGEDNPPFKRVEQLSQEARKTAKLSRSS